MLSIVTQFTQAVGGRSLTPVLTAALIALSVAFVPAAAKAEEAADSIEYATPSDLATRDLVLSAVKTGNRLVAVGQFGHAIYSDDLGVTWTQAASVPTQVTLTSVYFVNEKVGFAGGHDTTVLRTEDAGENWTLVYHDVEAQAPIMSVYFDTETHGLAMGAFSFVIETQDGGKTWEQRALIEGSQDDSHLNKVFATKSGTVLVAAEFGTVYRSTDAGKTFTKIETDYEGSFWGGTSLSDGTALIYGMRGNVYRTADDGLTWAKINSGTDKSVGGGVELANGTVVLTGLQGYVGYSTDKGLNFTEVVRADRLGYTAVTEGPAGQIAVFGEPGVKLQPDDAVKAAEEVGFRFSSGS